MSSRMDFSALRAKFANQLQHGSLFTRGALSKRSFWCLVALLLSFVIFTSSSMFASNTATPAWHSGLLNTFAWSSQHATLKEGVHPDKHYLVTLFREGWTNQVMDLMGSVHLALLSNRIPLLNAFIADPVHFRVPTDRLLVSDVFDLPRLKTAMGLESIVEVEDFKAPVSELSPRVKPQREPLGCWSYAAHRGWNNEYPWAYGLDTELTPLPEDVLMGTVHDHIRIVNIHKMADLVRPGRPYKRYESSTELITKFNLVEPKLDPEDQIACIDNAFGLSSTPVYSWDELFHNTPTGSWDVVGRYLRWTQSAQARAEDALREMLGVKRGEDIPPYVAVHVRRDDYANKGSLTPIDYAHAAAGMVAQLKNYRGITVHDRILILTDESDMEYRAEAERQFPRLHYVNHDALGTIEKYGQWWPIVIDNIIMSMSTGFVGTLGSTMSILACRRMTSWNSGDCSYTHVGNLAPQGWKWEQ